jgi:hypothetical protein
MNDIIPVEFQKAFFYSNVDKPHGTVNLVVICTNEHLDVPVHSMCLYRRYLNCLLISIIIIFNLEYL